MPITNKIRIYHKYYSEHKYHVQCHVNIAKKVFYTIRDHDNYIINLKSAIYNNANERKFLSLAHNNKLDNVC
jgi:hypothetical protein